MPTLLRMPEVAADATEAVLQEWTVGEHVAFAARDAIAVVETEKAIVDVEVEEPGVVLRHLVAAGARVEVGSPIALLGAGDEVVADIDVALESLGVGARTAPTAPSPTAAPRTAAEAPPEGRIFSSPIARRLARQAGLALADIPGSGPGGRITRRDVQATINGRPEPTASDPARSLAAPAPGAAASYTEIPHSRMRRTIATRLSESKRHVPHFYVRGTARVDRLVSLRTELNEGVRTRVSLNDLVVKAAARAHTIVPRVNVIWTDEALRQFTTVDVALAVATDGGLVTPVVRGVDRLPIGDVAATTRDLAERARAGTLRQSELEGGSLSVSNLGMHQVEEFAAIINQPQSAVLAVASARSQVVAGKRRPKVATVMSVTLSVDHRAVDGVLAAEWMAVFIDLLEHPVRILA